MTLLQLNYIAEIYNCGSINKAAQNLFVSQSSLSSSIRELEEEMGIKIFVRSNRGISLTNEGQEFMVQIREILEQQKKIERYYSKKNHYEVGKLSISAQRYPFCTQAFVELLNNEHFENFEFTYKETDMDKVIKNVSSQKSDIGIIFLRDITEKFMNKILASHDLEFIELTRIKPHVFLSTDHPLANKTEISTKELIDFPYVVFARNNNISYNYSEEVIFHTTNEFGKVIYINDRATAYNIISNSHCFSTGSGLLPSKYCPNNLKAIPLSNDTDLMRLGWVKLIDMPINPLALKFIDILKNIIIK